jgi:hypothetical protein
MTLVPTATSREMRRGRRVLRGRVGRARLRALDEGRAESRTLAEWLAVDMATLLETLGRELGPNDALRALVRQLRQQRPLGVTRRLTLVGGGLHATVGIDGAPFRFIATHPSDVVRQWACYAVGAAPGMTLAERLRRIIPFAADPNMTVRECAWMTFRPHLAHDLERGLGLLEPLVHGDDANVRRFAVEVSRRRSVWGRHLEPWKRRPAHALRLLDPSVPTRAATSLGRSRTGSTMPASPHRRGYPCYVRHGCSSRQPRRRGSSDARCAH